MLAICSAKQPFNTILTNYDGNILSENEVPITLYTEIVHPRYSCRQPRLKTETNCF